VPITLKDSLRVRGVRSTFGGLPPYAWHRPRSDSKVAERLRHAGAIVLGRTNLPLLALDWQCNNPFFRSCMNPWDLARTPGGSSGGAAAALAAGFAPLELGSDLGGSIRYPAHCRSTISGRKAWRCRSNDC
jgi:amidase